MRQNKQLEVAVVSVEQLHQEFNVLVSLVQIIVDGVTGNVPVPKG